MADISKKSIRSIKDENTNAPVVGAGLFMGGGGGCNKCGHCMALKRKALSGAPVQDTLRVHEIYANNTSYIPNFR